MRRLITITSLLVVYGCNNISQENYEKLKAENQNLKSELNEFKFGSANLLLNAKKMIAGRSFENAKSELNSLLERHPDSKEAKEAKELLKGVEVNITKVNDLKEKAVAQAERSKNEAIKSLRKKTDDIRSITWYSDKSTPQYTNSNSFHLYFGTKKDAKPWLQLAINYTADDWLFIKRYIIKTDNDTYTINPSYSEINTDNGGGEIWEWYDVTVDQEKYKMIEDIIKSKNSKIRHEGKQYYKDRTITQKEKQALQNILTAYKELGGEQPNS
ncbi:hypothetical protein [Sphingobacterium sp. GVS05A]|uniref:hypothetical protein n=1 Tax=Sphingobacterium sp. GVS05A TaxID=2862679 RepID=UPI001CBB3147|nr:hypothetical protein [Sphingobacterium sp. GVS05A]